MTTLSNAEPSASVHHVVREITPANAHSQGRTFIDVREAYELDAGYIPDALHLERTGLATSIEDHVPDRTTPLTIYCAAGSRSLVATRSLLELGYSNVVSLKGGFEAWRQQGLPITHTSYLTANQRDRYQRHLLLPEVGERGQRKLLDARVLVIGAGGLGSPVAFYLAAAGIGTIGIVDFDTVESSNLQRQILHNEQHVGEKKTVSAQQTINALNSEINVKRYDEPLTAANAEALFREYNVVVNGCDNFPTRYLANDVAIFTNTALVDGSVNGFTGEITTLIPAVSACYRCRYPLPPSSEEAPSCSDGGVLGVLPGIVGTIQATEVIKLLLGQGNLLAGRLLHVDALAMTFREYAVPRDPGCPVCGNEPTITMATDSRFECDIPASQSVTV